MEENANWTREIIQNNELLKEQNAILRQLLCEQNAIFQQLTRGESVEREVFVENINHDEMRNGFLVTSQKKKLWNVQIGLINEVARICKKHNIRWFAGYGTLLGAARHKGFIPWDDDVDLLMFRPDYEKFKRVAAKEVKAPYFFDNWYNYRLESEGASLTDPEGDFQFITEEQQNFFENRWITQWPSIRLRDSRTSMIEFPNRNFINQGIWIDIFPLDPVPPLTQEIQTFNFNLAILLLMIAAAPERVKKTMQDNQRLLLEYDDVEKLLMLSYAERGSFFEDVMNENFFLSERIGDLRDFTLTSNQVSYRSKFFADVIHLPFEKIEVPAPADYDNVLKAYYGDWRTPVYRVSHAQFYSSEISWREYFQKTLFK